MLSYATLLVAAPGCCRRGARQGGGSSGKPVAPAAALRAAPAAGRRNPAAARQCPAPRASSNWRHTQAPDIPPAAALPEDDLLPDLDEIDPTVELLVVDDVEGALDEDVEEGLAAAPAVDPPLTSGPDPSGPWPPWDVDAVEVIPVRLGTRYSTTPSCLTAPVLVVSLALFSLSLLTLRTPHAPARSPFIQLPPLLPAGAHARTAREAARDAQFELLL